MYQKTVEEWTSLHQLVFDAQSEIDTAVRYQDLEEGILESSEPLQNIKDQFSVGAKRGGPLC